MGFSWSAKNISPIGVDFGADSLKLLQVQTDEQPLLIAAAAAEIPSDSPRDPERHRQLLSLNLKKLVREGGFKGKRIIASISAGCTYVQHVRLNKGEGIDPQLQLEAELRGRLPIDPAAMVIRSVPVGDVFADGANKHEVICMAASREAIMRTVQIAKAAGLDVVGMHCEPMAILAAFAHLFRRPNDCERTNLFVDIGGATTKALIAHGKQLVFAKTIHVGGEHMIRQLAAASGISRDDARVRHIAGAALGIQAAAPAAEPVPAPGVVTTDRRREGGICAAAGMPAIPTSGAAQSATPSPVTATAPTRVAGPVDADRGEMLDCLIDELQLCAGYHAAMFTDRPIEKLVFLGGESRHIAMCQKIAQALRLPAQLGDPLVRLNRGRSGAGAPVGVDLRQPQPGWAVPMGLCMLPTNL